ncbi:hypothetical protein ABZ639_13735 [Saccharomonospora sp. NPDC006951]
MSTRFCVHCGGQAESGGTEQSGGNHAACHNPRTALEPPRYCGQCARRMIVQVTPAGWSARCSRHGESTSAGATPTG